MINPKFKLYDFQKQGVEFALQAGACIIGDEMGLGKTIQAIALADKMKANTLVLCPAHLVDNWKVEVEKFLVKSKARFDFVPYSSLHKRGAKFFKSYDLLVADEIQYVKNLKAKRTQVFHAMLDHDMPNFFVGLSGTPIKNRVVEFYSPLLAIAKHPSRTNGLRLTDHFNSEREFCDYFSHGTDLFVNGITITRYRGLKNSSKLKELLSGKYIRRKADSILELPPILDKVVKFPMSELRKLDEKLQSDFLYGSSHLSTTKALSAKAKAAFSAKYALDVIEETGSVVVFTDHVDACEIIFTEIMKKHKCRVIQGSTPVGNRQGFVEEFQSGKVDALVCTIGAAGVGFTMTRASNLIFNDLSWVPGDNWQALKRVHRIGQKEKCCVHYIVGSEVDEQIVKTIKSKEKELREVL